MVSAAWLERNSERPEVRAFTLLSASAEPEAADRSISDVLRARFPEETVRPALNSRWG
jgi:hypothetical protein